MQRDVAFAVEGEFHLMGVEVSDAGVHRLIGLNSDRKADDDGGLAARQLKVSARAGLVDGSKLLVRGHPAACIEEADIVQVMVLRPAMDA